MRQYKIKYKRGDGEFATLTPVVHIPLYGRPEVDRAVAIIRENPEIDGVALLVGNERFNIIAFDQPAHAPNAFILDQ